MDSLARHITRFVIALFAGLCLQAQAVGDTRMLPRPHWRLPPPTESSLSPAPIPAPSTTARTDRAASHAPTTSSGSVSGFDHDPSVRIPATPTATRTGATRLFDPGGLLARDTPFRTDAFVFGFDEPMLGAATDPHERETSPSAPGVLGPWLAADGPSDNARQLLAWIEDAGVHGLNPGKYDLDGLREGISAVFEATPPRLIPSSPHAARAALAYRLRRAFTRLATNLGRGVVDARTVQPRLYRDPPDPDVAALRSALARGELDTDAALRRVAPTHPGYKRLNETMRALLAERVAGVTRTRVDPTGSPQGGHRHADVMRIKARLIETGDLAPDTVLTPMFDADLVLAVEGFQHRNGMPPTGIVDRDTRAALNRTLDEELDELALSLERWRWMPRELGERHIVVNLPDYRLHLNEGEQRIIDMPVVIGAVEHPTPSFSREMSYMEFNPTWTVPASIANEELVPLERRHPGYLKSREFDFLERVDDRLEKVPHESVTEADLHARPFPYVLRQRGGPINALGRVKFMMPNPYAIYLHDTQARRHFTLPDRAYSHGCIRLSDPDRLARLLMRIDGRSSAQVERVLASPETSRVRLRSPVPTHLAYFTTWVDEYGAIQRRADVYAHDRALRTALRAHEALPGAWLPPPGRGTNNTPG